MPHAKNKMMQNKSDLNKFSASVCATRNPLCTKMPKKDDDKPVMLPTRIKTFVTKRFSILHYLRHYSHVDAISDLIAGLTVGMTLLPQSMAYATLAGLTPEFGLYSSIMGPFLYAFFGTIKEVSIGPTSLVALLTINFTRDLPIDFVVLLTFLSGCVVLLMGILRLGFLVDFISAPVTSGFTSAVAVFCICSQFKGLFGVDYKSHSFIDDILELYRRVHDVRLADTMLGLACLVFLLALRALKDLKISPEKKALKRFVWFLSTGRNAIAVIICSYIAVVLAKYGQRPFKLTGDVPEGLPTFALPRFASTHNNVTYSFSGMVHELGAGVIVLPLMSVLANVAIAKSFAAGSVVDATQEMITLGLCNIMGSCIHSMPTTGAFTRSAISSASGVRTPLNGIYTGAIILLTTSFLTPYFYYVPKATLSAVLIAAVMFMVDYQIMKPLWRYNKFDLFITVATFVASLLFGVEVGLIFGVFLNVLFLLKLWARPKMYSEINETEHGVKYIVIKPQVGLYFPAVDSLRQEIVKIASTPENKNRPVLIDCSSVLGVDYSAHIGIQNLLKVFSNNASPQRIFFFNISPSIVERFERITEVDRNKFCYSLDQAVGQIGKNYDEEMDTLVKVDIETINNSLNEEFMYRRCSTKEIEKSSVNDAIKKMCDNCKNST